MQIWLYSRPSRFLSIERPFVSPLGPIGPKCADVYPSPFSTISGVVADNSVLETTHVNPKIVYRPNKTSTDPTLHLTPENGLVTKKAVSILYTKDKDGDGNKTPLASMFASKSPTPLPTSHSNGSTVRGHGDRDRAREDDDGWGEGPPAAAAASASANKSTGSGWDDEPDTTTVTQSTTGDDDGWGMPASKPAEDGNGWRGTTVREESSDIDLE